MSDSKHPGRFQWERALRGDDKLPEPVRAAAAGLSFHCKGVLLFLATWMDEDGGNCYPSVTRLIKATGLSRRRVHDLLKEATDAGWMRTDAPPGRTATRIPLIPAEPVQPVAPLRPAARVQGEESGSDPCSPPQEYPCDPPQGGVQPVAGDPCSPSHPTTQDQPTQHSTDQFGADARPRTPQRTESPTAPRADLEPEPDRFQMTTTEVDRESPVPSAREALPAVDLGADPDELSADELAETIKALMAHDLQRLRTIRFAARKKLGIASVTSSPRRREDLNRAIYRAWREEATNA